MSEHEPPGPFAAPQDDGAYRGVRGSARGRLILADPIRWHPDEGEVESVPIADLHGVSARRRSWIRLYIGGSLASVWALVALRAPDWTYVTPPWVFIAVTMALDRLVGQADVTVHVSDDKRWQIRVTENGAFEAVARLRRSVRGLSGPIDVAEMVNDAWYAVFWPDPSLPARPQRGLGLWLLFWTYVPSLAAIGALLAFTFSTEHIPMLVAFIGPILWLTHPLLALPGLFMQRPFMRLLPAITGAKLMEPGNIPGDET